MSGKCSYLIGSAASLLHQQFNAVYVVSSSLYIYITAWRGHVGPGPGSPGDRSTAHHLSVTSTRRCPDQVATCPCYSYLMILPSRVSRHYHVLAVAGNHWPRWWWRWIHHNCRSSRCDNIRIYLPPATSRPLPSDLCLYPEFWAGWDTAAELFSVIYDTESVSHISIKQTTDGDHLSVSESQNEMWHWLPPPSPHPHMNTSTEQWSCLRNFAKAFTISAGP